METSTFLAKVIGPYCIIVAVAFLINRQDYRKVADGVLKNAGVRCFGALLGLIIGLLLVNTHNVWEPSWRVLITLIGWISLVKGTILFIFPNHFIKFAENYQKNSTLLTVQLCLTFLFGLFLMCKGYF